MRPYYTDEFCSIYHGDCREVLPQISGGFDMVLTDPPYGLGFMGKGWDHAVPGPEYWAIISAACKPGANMFAFGGTRTWHRLASAIEDAGWEIRDTLMWLQGQGFPKSKDFADELHKKAESAAEHDMRFVRSTHLSTPVYACRECGQVLLACTSKQELSARGEARTKHQTAGTEQPSLEGWRHLEASARKLPICEVCTMSHGILGDGSQRRVRHGAPTGRGSAPGPDSSTKRSRSPYRSQPAQQRVGEPEAVSLERRSQAFRGYGTALKPAWEPIILAMNPLDGTFAANATTHGVAGINVDDGRIGVEKRTVTDADSIYSQAQKKMVKRAPRQVQGRWPANVILDEDAAAQLDKQSGPSGGERVRDAMADTAHDAPAKFGYSAKRHQFTIGDSGGASRFFYTAKASKADRGAGNDHPTVKPTALMVYLLTLGTMPEPSCVLDPFMGSGTTLKAAKENGLRCVGIDLDEHNCEIAAGRLEQGVLFAQD